MPGLAALRQAWKGDRVTTVAVLDADVLYPMVLRDTLLRAAAAGCFRMHWSARILDEVEGWEPLVDQTANDPTDRHVAAAAIAIKATAIVTSNLGNDIPDSVNRPHIMCPMNAAPKTLMEAVRYFSDAARTLNAVIEMRWPDGVRCPTCGRADVRWIATRNLWECKSKHPRKQFSAKVGTIFEDSALGLDKWLVALWLVANCKNGISSRELGRAIGVTQKSAWHMLRRIRLAMEAGGIIGTGPGEYEADETYVGGRAEDMHASKRAKKITGPGG